VERDAVQVAVSRGLLEIYGTRPVRPAQDSEQFKLKYAEHPFGKFRRTIPLPLAARTEQLHAELRSGVLEIRVPREVGTTDVKTIPVG
jgi:HSP20 family molecular chaperone IbpA